MAKQKGPPPLSTVKPSARRRTALSRESSSKAKRVRNFTRSTSVLQTETVGLLQPETELERTFKVRQSAIRSQVDISTQSKASFELDLSSSSLSPYLASRYSRSGRSLIIASQKGHVSVCNWRQKTLQTELYLNETVRDATFLHNDSFFALAQRKYAYIYDSQGAQLHVLRNHREPANVVFLPHHLLLASSSAPCASHKKILYTDTSTGQVVADHDFGGKTLKLAAVNDAALNFSNGMLHFAHSNGVVSLWSPAAARPLAQVFAHAGGVRHCAVAKNGAWMVTSGGDCSVKIWDLKTFKLRTEWRLPVQTSSMTVSQRGLIGVSFGAQVQVWAPYSGQRYVKGKNGWGTKPYMSELYESKRITGLDFCPFEDMLAVCWEGGMKTMVVPGAGEPTFDSRAPNPYETRKQRSEAEVRTLLDKLPPASIALDASFVGGVEQNPAERLREIRERARAAADEKRRKGMLKKKARGRSKISKRLRRKQDNVIEARKDAMREQIEAERKTREKAKAVQKRDEKAQRAGIADGAKTPVAVPDALKRFFPKK